MGNIVYQPANSSPTWESIQNKPSTFPPSTHSHNASEIATGTLSADRLPASQNQTAFVKDGVTIDNWLFQNGQLQCYANNGGLPALGLHSGNKEAIAIYYLNNELRTKRNTGQDYRIAEVENGTWTPLLSPGNHSYSYTANSGIFHRIGNLVLADFICSVSAKDAAVNANSVNIGGLPVAHANNRIPTLVSVVTVGVTASGAMIGLIGTAASSISLNLQQGGTAILFSACSSAFSIRGTVAYPI